MQPRKMSRIPGSSDGSWGVVSEAPDAISPSDPEKDVAEAEGSPFPVEEATRGEGRDGIPKTSAN